VGKERMQFYLNALVTAVQEEGDMVTKNIDNSILYNNILFRVDEAEDNIATEARFPNGNPSTTAYFLDRKWCREASDFNTGKVCYLEPLVYLFSFLHCIELKEKGYEDEEVERIRKVWFEKNLREIKKQRIVFLNEDFIKYQIDTSFDFMAKVDKEINPFLEGEKLVDIDKFIKEIKFSEAGRERFVFSWNSRSSLKNQILADKNYIQYSLTYDSYGYNYKIVHYIGNISEEQDNSVCDFYKKIKEKVSCFIDTTEYSLMKTDKLYYKGYSDVQFREALKDDEAEFKSHLDMIIKKTLG
jgi:hypothetical protein